jgi:3-oxoacyl-(acyl-carrier-protein) synthase
MTRPVRWPMRPIYALLGNAAESAVRCALAGVGVEAVDIGFVHPSGTAMRLNGQMEAAL